MSDDDDLRTTYDLEAWAPPAPSGSLADAVIARLRQPPAVVAIEPEDAPTRRRRWHLAGGLAGALAAAVVAVVVVGSLKRAPGVGSGTIIADTARSVELGESRVQLDPGAELAWERAGDRVRAVLRRGSATFSVAGEDTFEIDGAALASVTASGASLRMEAKMNLSDARVIGASAVTAAAVAMLTIVVYEGSARATHGGQTVTIEAGGTLDVRAPGPPRPPSPTEVAVGAGLDVQAQLDEKDREIERLRKALSDTERLAAGDASQSRPAQKQPRPPPPVCDVEALAEKGDDMAANGMWAAALASWEAAMRCKPSAMLVKKAAIAACNSRNAAKANAYIPKLDKTSATSVLQICIRNGTPIKVAASNCDAAAAEAEGEIALKDGQDALALGKFELALSCGAGATAERLAAMAACRIGDAARARRHVARLSPQASTGITQICIRNGIDLSDVKATGELRVTSKPPARVFVDGKEYGQTPMSMQIVPGKHKVTFQVGDAKYTFPVVIEAGKTVSMVKSLE